MPLPLPRQNPAFVSHSERLRTDYAVFVEGPAGGGSHPTVVFLDGDYSFGFAARAYRRLRAAGAVPEAVVVAVGYGHSFGEPGNFRGRDYTPTSSPEEPESGGADSFLEHLVGPLWQELEARYPVDRECRYVAGHSLGGLFALHAFFQPRQSFCGALVGAPSIWWDNRSFLARLAQGGAVQRGRLFLGIGEQDTESMLEDYDLLLNVLCKTHFRGVQVENRRFPGRNHYDVTDDLMSEGLRHLLNP